MNNASGKIIVITAPSGSGKTTIVKKLLQEFPLLQFSISACTRNPRPNELHGKDYYFLSEAEFQNHIAEDNFIEWEMVYTGKYYGTLKEELQRIWDTGRYPLVDIDVQGALSIKNKFPEQTLTIFIKAPSLEELERRLQNRGTETPETLRERVDKAIEELSFADQFDKIVINDTLEHAVTEIEDLVTAFVKA